MEKIERKYYIRLICVGIIALIIHALLILPLYETAKKRVLKQLFQEITEMDIAYLDEDEEETMEEYQKEKLDILIVDEEFQTVYYNKRRGSYEMLDGMIEKTVVNNEELFSEKPDVQVARNGLRDILRLRGTVIQKGKRYYIYIRKDIEDIREIVWEMLVYWIIGVLILCILAGYSFVKIAKEYRNGLQKDTIYFEKRQKEFIANISHELKTPLTVVLGQVEMLQMAGEQIDQEYYFSSIKEELDKMSSMIGNLLDVTMLDDKLHTMKMNKTSVSEIMEYLVMRYEALFRKKQIRLHTEIEKGCSVIGNRMYLEQALNNMIMNAFQHTAEGDEIQISLHTVGNRIRIEIFNEGEQIKPEQLPHIWESYYTTSKKVEEGAKNVGLGLYIAREIINRHEGKTDVINEENGVRFWIELQMKGIEKNG